jgi:hypothetical protein
MIERMTGTRYVVPLREGGSLPAVVEAEGERGSRGTYVVKFLGAGQGAKALVAELLAARLADELGLPIPRFAIVELAEGFGKSEPDGEIQDILEKSIGENFGLGYLSSALAFDPAVERDVDPAIAADIVWFDALITNVDRTPRNVNLLVAGGRFWLIDHGASLFIHHGWHNWESRVHSPFPQIKDHVLLHMAGDLTAADARLRPKLDEATIRAIVADVPDSWLAVDPGFESVEAHRERYVYYLLERLNGPRAWLQEAIDAQERGPVRYEVRATHRVV